MVHEQCPHTNLRPVAISGLSKVREIALSPRQQKASELAADACFDCGLLIFHLTYGGHTFEGSFQPRLTREELDELGKQPEKDK